MLESKFDEKQLLLLNKIKDFAKQIENKSFFSFFNTNRLTKRGIYLYGSVGNGKTVLMQHFYQMLQVKKLMFHYQNLMQLLHKDIYQLRNESVSKSNIIKTIAMNYAGQAKVICIDEFEVKDITDAMIIKPLLVELIKVKVFIFITSNIAPNDLYKDGLQKNSFLPIIEQIIQKFEIMHLDSTHDYRLDKIIQTYGDRIIYPINQHNQLIIQKLISQLNNNARVSAKDIMVFGRAIPFKMVGEKVLITDFEELFIRELGYVDYVTICQKFSMIIVENIRIIDSGNTDLAVRFINFIDNAYFYKVILFMTLQDQPEKIYQNGIRQEEFKRTISRLHEMNNGRYGN